MRNLFNESMKVCKRGEKWHIMIEKSWGSAPAYDSTGKHEIFTTKSEAKDYMYYNYLALI